MNCFKRHENTLTSFFRQFLKIVCCRRALKRSTPVFPSFILVFGCVLAPCDHYFIQSQHNQRLCNRSFGLETKKRSAGTSSYVHTAQDQWVFSVHRETWVDTGSHTETFFPSCSSFSTGTSVSRPAPASSAPARPFRNNELLAPRLPRLHRHPGGAPADRRAEPGEAGHQ